MQYTTGHCQCLLCRLNSGSGSHSVLKYRRSSESSTYDFHKSNFVLSHILSLNSRHTQPSTVRLNRNRCTKELSIQERIKEKECENPMVLTSHDQLGNTGLKTGFLAGRGSGYLLRFQGRWRPVDSRLTRGRTASDRSKERSGGKSDARPGPF